MRKVESECQLSIVSTLYESEETIDDFIDRCHSAAVAANYDSYELILVNDGSSDRGLSKALTKCQDRGITSILVDLSRNFGHHKALLTGLGYSSGAHIFLIDSDLEEEPELLLPFRERMTVTQSDVIYGIQKNRKGSLPEKLLGSLFYFLFEIITNLQYPKNVLTARLMNRKYVDSLMLYRESEPYLIGLWSLVGFTQNSLVVEKKSLSLSQYTLKKKLSLAFNSIVSFSNRPLKGILYLGISAFVVFLVYGAKVLVDYIINRSVLEGWTSTILSIWGFGSLTLLVLGLNALYLSKIYLEVKNRPFTIIKNIYRT